MIFKKRSLGPVCSTSSSSSKHWVEPKLHIFNRPGNHHHHCQHQQDDHDDDHNQNWGLPMSCHEGPERLGASLSSSQVDILIIIVSIIIIIIIILPLNPALRYHICQHHHKHLNRRCHFHQYQYIIIS